MKKFLIPLLCSAILLLCGGCNLSDKVRIGTAAEGGNYYIFGSELNAIDSLESYNINIKRTAGSAANMRLLSENYLQMAVVQTDIIDDAWNGRNGFTEEYHDFGAVAGLFTESCQIAVRSDSDIKSVSDLKGKAVSIGEEESGTAHNARQILTSYGIAEEMIKTVNLDYKDAASQLENGTIDAFFCTIGAPNPTVKSLCDKGVARLVSLDSDRINDLVSSYGYYSACTIPTGTYKGQTEDVKTIGVTAVLLAGNSCPKDTVKAITKAIFDNSETIQNALPVNIVTDRKSAVNGINISFHPGAAEYYGENGINVETE